MTKRLLTLIVATMLTMTTFVGCDNSTEAPVTADSSAVFSTETTETAETTESSSEANVSDESIVEETDDYLKFNQYSDLDTLIYEFDSLIYLYDTIVVPGETFQLAEGYYFSDLTGAMSGNAVTVSTAGMKMDTVAQMVDVEPSYPEIDAIVEDTVAIMHQVRDIFLEIQTMPTENVDTARAQELHSLLNSIYDEYMNTTLAYSEAFWAVNEIVTEQSLQQQLENNELISYHGSMIIELSADLDEVVFANMDDTTGAIVVDSATIQPLVAEIDGHVDSFLGAMSDPEQIAIFDEVANGNVLYSAAEIQETIITNYAVIKDLNAILMETANTGGDISEIYWTIYDHVDTCITIYNQYLIEKTV